MKKKMKKMTYLIRKKLNIFNDKNLKKGEKHMATIPSQKCIEVLKKRATG